jgi:hypothetical protein
MAHISIGNAIQSNQWKQEDGFSGPSMHHGPIVCKGTNPDTSKFSPMLRKKAAEKVGRLNYSSYI